MFKLSINILKIIPKQYLTLINGRNKGRWHTLFSKSSNIKKMLEMIKKIYSLLSNTSANTILIDFPACMLRSFIASLTI